MHPIDPQTLSRIMGVAMSKRDELSEIAASIAETEGVELYWLELRQTPGRWLLQVMIDKAGGVTLDDCERVSRALEDPFDEAVDQGYELEVSSPGLDRPLRTEGHFHRVIGEAIRIKTYAPIAGQRNWTGTLQTVDSENVALATDQGELEVPLAQLADARVCPPFDPA